MTKQKQVVDVARKVISSILTISVIWIGIGNVAFSQEKKKVNVQYIVNMAEIQAGSDVKDKSSTGWLLGAFLASAIASPLLGGLGTVLFAYNSDGSPTVPSSALMQLQNEYPDDFNVNMTYRDAYEKHYTNLIKKKNGSAALGGTGMGFLLNLLIISSMQ